MSREHLSVKLKKNYDDAGLDKWCKLGKQHIEAIIDIFKGVKI